MQSDKTFTTRSNAKRNAIKAGIPAERVEIVPHGKGDGVRFGWRQVGKKPATTVRRRPKVQAKVFADADNNGKGARILVQPQERETRNGVRRPLPGSKCGVVWDWLDKNPGISIKDAKAAAPGLGFNINNLVAEYYQHRKWVAAA